MPKYRVTLSNGRTFDVEASAPPSEADILAHLDTQTPESGEPSEKPRTWMDTAKDVGIGLVKGLGSSVAGAIETAANAGVIPGVVPSAFNEAMRSPAFTRAEEITTATNTPQMIGKGLEMAGELAVPTGQAVNAIPRASRAAGKFQEVMGAARHIPIDVEAPGQVGLRIMQLAERGGGSLPRPVSQFLQWVTNPQKEPMTYEVARDFASGISRLSANEMGRLAPNVAREVASLRVELNKAVGQAANKAGKGREYAEAMTEYAKAMRLRNAIDEAVQGAKRAAIPAALGAAAGSYWLTKKITSMLPGGE